jgi:hypothetical protein
VLREGDSLAHWNVGIVSRGDAPSTIDFGASVGRIGTVMRSRLDDGIDGARLGTVTDQDDERFDSDEDPRSARLRDEGENPLLLIYPIDRRSKPRSEDSGSKGFDRVALNAPEDVIGLAVCMPRSRNSEGVGYVQPDIAVGDGLTDEERAEVMRMMAESLRGEG